jgi:hypothetical protein
MALLAKDHTQFEMRIKTQRRGSTWEEEVRRSGNACRGEGSLVGPLLAARVLPLPVLC